MKMYNASDDRDKVFALLSICSDGKHGDLKPDYNLPLVDVYTNVAVHIMSRDKDLDILAHCHHSYRQAFSHLGP